MTMLGGGRQNYWTSSWWHGRWKMSGRHQGRKCQTRRWQRPGAGSGVAARAAAVEEDVETRGEELHDGQLDAEQRAEEGSVEGTEQGHVGREGAAAGWEPAGGVDLLPPARWKLSRVAQCCRSRMRSRSRQRLRGLG